MNPVEHFEELRELEGRQVEMRFSDGHEVIARLLSVTVDMDGSRHLLYDKVEWSNDANAYHASDNTSFYAEGETLVAIDPIQEQADA